MPAATARMGAAANAEGEDLSDIRVAFLLRLTQHESLAPPDRVLRGGRKGRPMAVGWSRYNALARTLVNVRGEGRQGRMLLSGRDRFAGRR
jgi:hypothetical protein